MANYPERPAPKNKAKSSARDSRKSKTWLSACNVFEGGRDISPRLNARWCDAPMYKNARVARWA